jgi:hypothetical protein
MAMTSDDLEEAVSLEEFVERTNSYLQCASVRTTEMRGTLPVLNNSSSALRMLAVAANFRSFLRQFTVGAAIFAVLGSRTTAIFVGTLFIAGHFRSPLSQFVLPQLAIALETKSGTALDAARGPDGRTLFG